MLRERGFAWVCVGLRGFAWVCVGFPVVAFRTHLHDKDDLTEIPVFFHVAMCGGGVF
jgi:hypothetical protein